MPKYFVLLIMACSWVTPTKLLAADAAWVGNDFSGTKCQGQGNRGRDYTSNAPGPQGKEFLHVVEDKHFGPGIRSLDFSVRGGVKTLAFELNYVLGQYPNHHQALYLLSRLPEKITQTTRVSQTLYRSYDENPVYSAVVALSANYNRPRYECYYMRAIAWQPNDPVLPMLYGIYAHKTGKYDLSESNYLSAIKLKADYGEAYYNMGLLLFDLQRYEDAEGARENAKRYGYDLPGLERKLAAAKLEAD